MTLRFCTIALFLLAGLTCLKPCRADVVYFTEGFNTGSSNWVDTNSAATTWNMTGGVGGGGYISVPYTVPAPASFPANGVVLFRGNDSLNASNDGFVGNWLSLGVTSFSMAIRHTSTAPLNLNFRFASPSNNPGASTSNFTVPVSTEWQTITIPIYHSVGAGNVFQSYGSQPATQTGFNTIFSNIGNIQMTLGNMTGLSEGSAFTVQIDNPTLSVPEPGSIALGAMGVVGAGLMLRRRLKKPAA
jgi:hypothetical protein